MAAQKKQPMRHCVGCNAELPKQQMLRVVRCPDGTVVLDRTGKVSGRGAYLCGDIACFRKARKSGRIAHNLGCEIPEEVYDRLERESGEAHG